MISGFKNLSFLTKAIFLLSLLLLFIWVIPTMVSYYENVKQSEVKENALEKYKSKYSITGEIEKFTSEKFKKSISEISTEVFITELDSKRYKVIVELHKDDIGKFNTFLESISLRYSVRIDGPLIFQEKDKVLAVTMELEEI